MHVREWGLLEGRPLVFWHALGAVQSGAMLTELAPTLTDAGLRLIAPDAPGFGQSPPLPPERYELEPLLELLEWVLDDRGIDRALVMGHSWGGSVVSGFASRYPERVEGLILVDSGQMDYQDSPGFPQDESLEQLIQEAGERIRLATDDFATAAQEGLRRPVTPELLEAARAAFREEDGELVAILTPEVRGAVLHGIAKSCVTDGWPAIAAARIPTLLLLATEPAETREQNERAATIFARRFPAADIHWIEDAGHDLLADAAPEVARLVRDWTAGLST
jgi:pimeloyl-ACP methyl ester carboxylesterase